MLRLNNQCWTEPPDPRLPCVILVDTSDSMAPATGELYEGLVQLGEVIKEDHGPFWTVDFCIIAFDDDARVEVPFISAYDYHAPMLTCGGMTAMHKAVDLALEELEARKDQYKENKTAYLRPWIFMMTDGAANDADNGAFGRLIQSQRDKHCTFFPIAIGDEVDMKQLGSLKLDGTVLKASKDNFKGAFVWLGNSLSGVLRMKMVLPNPADYNMEIFTVNSAND